MSKKSFIFITSIIILIFSFLMYVSIDRKEKLLDVKIAIENDLEHANKMVNELKLDSVGLQRYIDELETDNETLIDDSDFSIKEKQTLQIKLKEYETDIDNLNTSIKELRKTEKEYKHENIINFKTLLLNSIEVGMSKDRVFELVGNEYQECDDEESNFWRFDLLKDANYSYDDTFGNLDIEGMMNDKVGIVLYINWTVEDKIWYYTVLYKNNNENSICEFRYFANGLTRESEIYRE